ncbi:MAG TPA: AAA-like domain-containing protein [Blastocatellia bacterium]|nr:AAA-like domain-containing protein [Blastocatellia bacterium]
MTSNPSVKQRVSCLYEFGVFRLDAAERLLLHGDQPIALTSKVFDILTMLVENSGHLLEKDTLIQAIWPDTSVEEGNLTRYVSTLRKTLGEHSNGHRYIETVSKCGYRFVAEVRKLDDCELVVENERTRPSIMVGKGSATAGDEELKNRCVGINSRDSSPDVSWRRQSVPDQLCEPVGGAVPLDSEFYIVRATDGRFRSAIAQCDSIVLVKGARQAGKSSLLARGLEEARRGGARVVLTDFQMLNSTQLESAGELMLALARLIAEELELDVLPEAVWKPGRGPSINLERYLRNEALNKSSGQIVWGLDEIDRLFPLTFASEVFGLFRSWHNRRALDPDGPWRRLTMAIAYATEAHLFISDLNQSPFNVGTRLLLEDFTLEQVAELNRRYGSPLTDANDVALYFQLVGGHPFLVQRGLYEKATRGVSLSELEAGADSSDGPFGDHLRRLLACLSQDSRLCEAMREVLQNRPCPDVESFYRLRSAGVLLGDSARDAAPRCHLYSLYLKKHLL